MPPATDTKTQPSAPAAADAELLPLIACRSRMGAPYYAGVSYAGKAESARLQAKFPITEQTFGSIGSKGKSDAEVHACLALCCLLRCPSFAI